MLSGAIISNFGFQLRFNRKRNVDSHLVTVEVRVEGSADERMDADRFTFDQDGSKAWIPKR